MDLKKLIEDYLEQAKVMQVATAIDNQPWACSVYFAFDQELKFYWISKPDTRHSQEIIVNAKVAGTIVLPHNLGDKVRGIQFQGVAKEEVKDALGYYAKRYNLSEERIGKIIDDTDGHHVYKIAPSEIVLFDELNFPDNPRQEYLLVS